MQITRTTGNITTSAKVQKMEVGYEVTYRMTGRGIVAQVNSSAATARETRQEALRVVTALSKINPLDQRTIERIVEGK